MIFRTSKSGLLRAKSERLSRKNIGSAKEYAETICAEYEDLAEYRIRAITYK